MKLQDDIKWADELAGGQNNHGAMNRIMDAARRVANLDIEKGVKAMRRFIEAFEGNKDKPYESGMAVILAALGITEDE